MRSVVLAAMAVLSCSVAAGAQTAPAGSSSNETTTAKPVAPTVQPQAADTAMEATNDRLTISSDQEQRIRTALTTAPVQAVDDTKMSFAPGVVAPPAIELQPLPPAVAGEGAGFNGRKFFAGRTHFFIVDERSRRIVAVVQKNTGL